MSNLKVGTYLMVSKPTPLGGSSSWTAEHMETMAGRGSDGGIFLQSGSGSTRWLASVRMEHTRATLIASSGLGTSEEFNVKALNDCMYW